MHDEPDRGVTDLLERPPESINWNLLASEDADREWHDLDAWVTWLKVSFGLPPSIVPPYWHRHDELVWELSALHTHWLSCYHESASPSAPIAWMRDFADARHRLRDWVSTCGTRLDRDRPTRQTVWPGEQDVELGGEISIADRRQDFEEVVRADVLRRRAAEAMASRALLG
ncbi:hypothetical protein [Nocardioides marmotae]|nr:hypothetical protein [Nocardioides marmotae]